MNPEVRNYIESAPEEQRAILAELREMIVAALPWATEVMGSSRFPVYTVGGQWVSGFASRKQYPMFYLMLGDVMARHSNELGKLVAGRSCIEYRPSKEITEKRLKEILRAMLDDAAKMLVS